ncbi:DUF2855 family protein [Brevundimonas sp. R86498]|uniref:DUF2855 family protein n=1 Tax=Brevundimonas sp. R86498 TaxID=3093845 RepID=UPI0037C70926
MNQFVQMQVARKDLHTTRIQTFPLPQPAEGEVVVAVDRFALTANNVSYAVTGDLIGYWGFFPVDADWGLVPVWGYGTVVASACPGLDIGERLYGFFPMASHVVLKPGRVRADPFIDFADHRRALPGLYNLYSRVAAEPPEIAAMGDERCLLFPLFATSYILSDYLEDNAMFGASRVLIGSASSKTAFGLAWLLARAPDKTVEIVGLTSPGNVAFTQSLDVYDRVLTYDKVEALETGVPTAFIDMSGSGAVIRAIDDHLGENVVLSSIVGATHWDAKRHKGETRGATPTFFFAPAQFGKREQDWGPGVAMVRAQSASARIASEARALLEVRHGRGPEAVRDAWLEMVDGRTPPAVGVMLSVV